MISHQLRELTQDFLPVSETPALDAELLVAHVLGKDRNFVLTNPSKKLNTNQLSELEKLKQKRLKHYPVPYLTNKQEFFGREFFVDENVLIPRPDTETLIAEAIQTLAGKTPSYAIDIGTGSGCIAITLAKEIPDHTYLATDISPEALKTASLNAIKHLVRDEINFYLGNLLEPVFHKEGHVPPKNLLITANLPYLDLSKVPSEQQATQGILREPRLALHGGDKGLKTYYNFLGQIHDLNIKDSTILIEISPEQKKYLEKLIKKLLPHSKVETKKDLSQQDRVIRIEL